MSFLGSLRRIDPERRAVITSDGSVLFGELCDRAQALTRALIGARIVIDTVDVVDAVTMMAAADGRANRIGLVSPHMDAGVASILISRLEPTLVVTDRVEKLREAGVSPSVLRNRNDVVARADSSADAQDDADTSWILSTSGTTGIPKLVSHGLESLTRTTRCDAAKGWMQVWGLLYDYTRFAGLQVILQSLLSGACLASPAFTSGFASRLNFLSRSGCTHLSATPTMWRKILMTSECNRLALRQVTLGGEIADDPVLTHLAKTFPDARISHLFASTEAGVGFSVTDGKSGFPGAYLTDPPVGIGLKIVGGRLHVSNEQVMPAYFGEETVFAPQGWVDTGDMVDIVADRVVFKGRAGGVINVGGNKVHPEEVERVMAEHPHVLMSRVYGKANPIMGHLVIADIVPGQDAPPSLRNDLLLFMKGKLEKYMIPASIHLMETFEVNVAGKIQRKA